MNRQKQILAVLLVVLALVGARAFWSTPTQQQVPVGGQEIAMNAAGSSQPAKKAVDPLKVKLELLEPVKEKYPGYKRDIFNFYVPKPKPIVKPVVKTVPKPVVKPPPVPKAVSVITPQVRKQLAKFTFLGFLIKDQVRTVFLSKRDELFLVRKADFFGEDNQFEVMSITAEKLTIKQSGANGLIEIELREKEPLIPSFSPGEVTSSGSGSLSPGGAATAPEKNTVPPQQQRKRWFKNTQPPAGE